MQVIIRNVDLRQYIVPNLEWHTGISGEEACNRMVSPRSDDSLGYIGSLIVWWYIFNGDLGSIAKK